MRFQRTVKWSPSLSRWDESNELLFVFFCLGDQQIFILSLKTLSHYLTDWTSRLVVQMAQMCNMINTLKRTPFFTFLMLPPHQCCSHTHNHWSINETECGLDVVCISLSLSLSLTTHTSNLLGFLMLHSSVANGRGFGSQRWKYFEEWDVIWTRKQRKVALHSLPSLAPHRSPSLSAFLSLSHTHNISFLFHSAWTGIAHISSAWMWFAAVESISLN